MPLYEIKETGVDNVRLIKADNPAQALRHVAASKFQTRAITDPAEAAEIAAGGVAIETAGQEPPAPKPEE